MALLRPLIARGALVAAALIAVMFMAGRLVEAGSQGPGRIVELNPSKIRMSVADQVGRADVVAVVTATGKSRVHWNSSDNREWSDQGNGRTPLIIRDDEFTVVRILRGSFPGSTLVMRGVGGTVGQVTMRYDGQENWRTGGTYLVFLRYVDTPTRDGFERALAQVDIGQSAFHDAGNGKWVNDAGVQLSEQDVSAR